MAVSDHSAPYLKATEELARALDGALIDAMAGGLAKVRERGGRLFILGVGGGAGHASHTVNDWSRHAEPPSSLDITSNWFSRDYETSASISELGG